MDLGRIIADETAHHYRELRDRRVPWLLVLLLTYRFHQSLCVGMFMGEPFDEEVKKILNTPLVDTVKLDRGDDDDHDRIAH